MRPGRNQTGMKIEIGNLFPLPGNFLFRWLLFACVVPTVKVTAKTGLKRICVYIHSGLNPCRSEVSRLGPAGGMT